MTIRITDQKGVSGVGGSRGVRGSSGTGARFTIDSGGATARMESKAPISILGGLEALIAIQSEDNTREKRRRSVKRGQSMLDLLDELKLALLAGQLPPDFMNRLSVMVRDSADSGDPTLDSIMDSIELRAEVELAKLRTAARSRG
ncbi:flagellar assembly protein FliX [Rhabdaerophilum sp. SD176]|uniref:flagellar assembly protein FliX n=1 Tax=Rhabdaerophilum sp. SD176 TaxID=2983548 RepID=UPI0024E01241|nr:flagellar assembly protein FliX [Rhabdaerophilum sp. SD176]